MFRIFRSDPDQISQKSGPNLTRSKSEKNYLVIQWSNLSDLFLLDRARRPRHNKKKIAEIGLVDREIIAKNDFSTPDQSWLHRITDRSVRNTTCFILFHLIFVYCKSITSPIIFKEYFYFIPGIKSGFKVNIFSHDF